MFSGISLRGNKNNDEDMEMGGASKSKKNWQSLMNNNDEEEKKEEPGFFQNAVAKVKGAATATSNAASNAYEQSAMYPYFVGLFCIGCLFLFLTICFLPFIVVAP